MLNLRHTPRTIVNFEGSVCLEGKQIRGKNSDRKQNFAASWINLDSSKTFSWDLVFLDTRQSLMIKFRT